MAFSKYCHIVHYYDTMSLLVLGVHVYSANIGQVEDMMPSQSEISVWLKQLVDLDLDVGMISQLLGIPIQYSEHAQILKHPGKKAGIYSFKSRVLNRFLLHFFIRSTC